MYTANAVDDELDATTQTPVDPVERDALQKELELIAELLEKLTYLKARRQSYLHSRSRQANNTNGPASAMRQTSSSHPPAPSA